MKASWWAVCVIAVAIFLGLIARTYPQPTAPLTRDPAQAQAWMVDSLPGIGGKRLQQALDSLRTGNFAGLPSTSRATARQVFVAPIEPK